MSLQPRHSVAEPAEETAPLQAEVERLRMEVAALRNEVARLETVSQEDALTQLLNRRGFLRDLDRALAFSRRYQAKAALLLLDLDGFKPINDRWGHATGDLALCHVANLLRTNLRSSDSIGRLGGDEFAILLWQVDDALALQKATSLEGILASTPLAVGAEQVAVPGSIGATVLTREDDSASALARADAAMYRRKRDRAEASLRR
jgi:diguanylate cyclase (GGDEF)-like protein